MAPQISPAFAAHSSPAAIAESKAKPWLIETLTHIKANEPLDQTYFTKILSSLNASWTLASLIFGKSELPSDEDNTVQIEAFVDDILCNKVEFKLTARTIEALSEYYTVHCYVGEQQHNKSHEDLIQAIECYVFSMPISVFEDFEKNGAVDPIQSQDVKTSILDLLSNYGPIITINAIPGKTSAELSERAFPPGEFPAAAFDLKSLLIRICPAQAASAGRAQGLFHMG
ncbi:uncharacterized protein PpBr36_10401 [Pyricularia pennisetigena]|uniref:uncharacterized protein n=1 Tax=Pyricularia pennisetigena TaxID=1578925 RepID=UPI0011503FC9|nr:uncharacterized protein PpBr36_10401 [Pyricularia pennisetigena]TLS21314.1 hypothetical protein PpBr36_10401 [Pyricularia pennisetigena]